MEHYGDAILIKDALVFLFAVGIAVPLFRLLKIPKVIGFLVAGISLGPFALGALVEQWPVLEYISISEPEAAAPFAKLGVLFLLFLLGLEFSFEKLWGMRKTVFGIGGLQTGLSAVLIGVAAFYLGLSATAATVVGLALALSSTAIVMQILIDERRAASPAGQTAYGVLIFQDIMVAPFLIFVGFAAQGAEGGLSALIVESLIEGLLAIFLIYLLGRFLLRRVFRLAASVGGRDFLMAVTLLTVLGAAVIMENAGLSMALGAFLAGMLLGETEFKHQTEVDIEPFKGLLLGLFFITMGMSLDLGVVRDKFIWILLAVLALLAVKMLVLALATRLGTGSKPLSVEMAFLMAPAGEFAFVILTAASVGGVLDVETTAFTASVVGLTMLANPLLAQIGNAWAERLTKPDAEEPRIENYAEHENHIIIIGFGRVGNAVAEILRSENAEILALDRDPRRVASARDQGWKVYLGDGTRKEILERFGISGASMFIVTVDDVKSAKTMVATARSLRADIPIYTRAQHVEHVESLTKAGASFVVPDAIESALQLARRGLIEFGYDEETARDRIAAERDVDYFNPPGEA
ncbi:MAG: portal protein [Hyphomonadaceae bacterium]|nr:portal protein [Hyphomonadaceae bacterium]